MSETIKVSEAKQGEWYDLHTSESDSGFCRSYCYTDGKIITETDELFVCSSHAVTHLPDCTGWDWKPESPERRQWTVFVDSLGQVGFVGNRSSDVAIPVLEKRPGDIDPDRALELVAAVNEFYAGRRDQGAFLSDVSDWYTRGDWYTKGGTDAEPNLPH